MVTCPECERLAAEADSRRTAYGAALLRLQTALAALEESTLEYEAAKSTADDLGEEFDRAMGELIKHRRTHLEAAGC